MKQSTNRRGFLRTVVAGGAGYWLTTSARSAERTAEGPNGKLAIACIGVGGRGADNVHGVQSETIVALCDVDERQAGKTFEKHIYEGAGHAFNNDTGANYNEAAATQAWQRTLDWFTKYLA